MVVGRRWVMGGCGSSWVVIVAGHQWESGGDVWVLPSCFLVVQVCVSHGPRRSFGLQAGPPRGHWHPQRIGRCTGLSINVVRGE